MKLKPIPFKINITKDAIENLRSSVINSNNLIPTYESTNLTENLGIKFSSLINLKNDWQSNFLDKWEEIEKELNYLPHFKSDINYGNNKNESIINLHFIHYPSIKKEAIPLILIHGWPGSFLEFTKLIKLLKESEELKEGGGQSYNLVIPSLPGYLFSQSPPLEKEFGIEEVGEILNNLMIGLGYSEGYAIQAGDWGSLVARSMATRYTTTVKAVHLNFIPAPPPPPPPPSTPTLLDKLRIPSKLSKYTIPTLLSSFIQTILSPILPSSSSSTTTTTVGGLDKKDLLAIKKTNEFIKSGRGYSGEHSTRPSTIGFVVDSNPVALLAWVGEKFLEWTDLNPSNDEILTSLTLWYLTHTFSTSIYPYRHLRKTPSSSPNSYIHQPVGFSSFAYEITPTPKSWASKTCNLVWYRYHSSGGHFAALEKPHELMIDLNEFFGSVWDEVNSSGGEKKLIGSKL